MPETGLLWQQMRRSLAIARKDIRIYYSKGPVVIFGILFPVFLFLSFTIGRHLSVDSMIPGLLGMILFFTATSISPIVVPWEAQARTLERLMSCPVRLETIIVGDVLASFAFGMAISLVPIIIGLALGVTVSSPAILALAVILAALCFASLGSVFSIPPTNLPATVNMIASVVKFPVVFISGIFIPLDELPAWGQAIAYISPLTYFTDIARGCIQGRGHLSLAVDFGALIAFTLLFLLVAMKLHQRTMPRRI
ncbi:MAG: ABC transporter [Chloroflexi bacterium RBG_13_54_8]|nr:MAG: ABC transporter [Chloroflexi bacterium RBG_13_54_8]